MEKELDERLARLQLEQYLSVTDHTKNDCLFVAAIDRIREYAYGDRTRKKLWLRRARGTWTPYCMILPAWTLNYASQMWLDCGISSLWQACSMR
jgi:hypothetical protein